MKKKKEEILKSLFTSEENVMQIIGFSNNTIIYTHIYIFMYTIYITDKIQILIIHSGDIGPIDFKLVRFIWK